MKEKYERTVIDIIKFETEELIMTSGEAPLEEPRGRYMMPIR